MPVKKHLLCLVMGVLALSLLGGSTALADAGSPVLASPKVPAPSTSNHKVTVAPTNLAPLPKPDSVEVTITSEGNLETAHYGDTTIATLKTSSRTVSTLASGIEGVSPSVTCPQIYNTGAPSLSGDARSGGAMSVTNGSWFICGDSITQIQKSWSNGMGGDSNTMGDADADRDVYVDVTACGPEAGCAGARSNSVHIAPLSGGGGGGGGGGVPLPAVTLRVISPNPMDAGQAAVLELIGNAARCDPPSWNPEGKTNGNFSTGIINNAGTYHYQITCYNSANAGVTVGTNPDLVVNAAAPPPPPPPPPPSSNETDPCFDGAQPGGVACSLLSVGGPSTTTDAGCGSFFCWFSSVHCFWFDHTETIQGKLVTGTNVGYYDAFKPHVKGYTCLSWGRAVTKVNGLTADNTFKRYPWVFDGMVAAPVIGGLGSAKTVVTFNLKYKQCVVWGAGCFDSRNVVVEATINANSTNHANPVTYRAWTD